MRFFTFKCCKKMRTWKIKKRSRYARVFFSQKPLANLNYFTLNERANNFTSDGEKLIAVCYSQQKL